MATSTRPASPPPPILDEIAIGTATLRRVSWRLLPFLFVLYVFNFLDRTNVGIAALQMNRDLQFSATAYGFGAGIFFVGYALFEVPSNLILARVGTRRWIARIMISWGLLASATMFVQTPMQFYVVRFLLGVAEAGFFPGIVYYLSLWFPADQRARAMARFMIAIPLSGAIGNPLGAWLLGFDGAMGLAGWQWLFLIEGLPSVVLGFAVLAWLTDYPKDARWLAPEQRDWLAARLARDGAVSPAGHTSSVWRALAHPAVWALALLYFLMLTLMYSYTFWAPLLIRDGLQASNTATGIITGGIALLTAGFMLLVGASSDRTGERFVHVAGCALVSAAGCLGAALLPHPVARAAALAVVFFGAVGFASPFWCLPTMLTRGTAAAAAIALVNSFGNVGGFAGPYVMGVLHDATGGTEGAFVALAAVAVLAAGVVFVLQQRLRR